MLPGYMRGYAVMTRELDAYSFEHEYLEKCIEWCRKDCVVVEMIPQVCGFNIRVWWSKYSDGIQYDKYSRWLCLWHLNIQYNKEWCHKKGKIVYDPLNKQE